VPHLESKVECCTSSAAREIGEMKDRLQCVQQTQLLAEVDLLRADTTEEGRRAALQITELRTSLAQAEQETRAVREALTEMRRVVQARDAKIAEIDARLQADANRFREQQAESDRTVVFLRRDVDVKDAYIATLRERERELERACAHTDARVKELDAEATRLREIEAAALRVPTTPRYWLADHLNLALKRTPSAHRMLRAMFVRIARIERSA
jgi:chromosome segregation ATPase